MMLSNDKKIQMAFDNQNPGFICQKNCQDYTEMLNNHKFYCEKQYLKRYKDFEARNPDLSGNKAYNFKMWKIDQRMEQSCKNILGKAYSKAPSFDEISEFLVFEQCLEKLEDFADDVLEITDNEWAFPDIAQSYMNFYNDDENEVGLEFINMECPRILAKEYVNGNFENLDCAKEMSSGVSAKFGVELSLFF